MKIKRFIIGLSSFLFTTSLLYLSGHLFSISLLMLHFKYTNSSNGLSISIGSLLPFIFGLIVSYISEKSYVNKYHRKLHKFN
ncbi:hypothetical protein J2X07_001434 [Fictibacillus barbaricus]|uniref:Major facilitator superfamily (MFS) profile domain-containing protein n=1 Tax=Fictibacillus barbaricus TaxID=182136 RepID=A0ABU1TZ40_9BACL|nr:hypothetical protein [Fictibacillus barbaricus]